MDGFFFCMGGLILLAVVVFVVSELPKYSMYPDGGNCPAGDEHNWVFDHVSFEDTAYFHCSKCQVEKSKDVSTDVAAKLIYQKIFEN
jgi:hypothetical protein